MRSLALGVVGGAGRPGPGRVVARSAEGIVDVGSLADVEAAIKADRARMFRRYVASKRHTMQVDYDNYLHDLGKELKAGAVRARATGFALPVPPRAKVREAAAA